MSTTPQMGLILPAPEVTSGPTYAEQNTVAFETLDSHDHTPGKGVLIPVAALNLNGNLDLSSTYSVKNSKILQGASLPAALVDSQNINSFQVVNGEAWFVNKVGTATQITDNGAIITPPITGLPPGTMVAFSGLSVPAGWLAANGALVSRATYAALFAAMGETYGAGDGSTTFALPDKRGRVSVGSGAYVDPVSGTVSRTQGAKIGAEKHVLSVSELATHTHVQNSHSHTTTAPWNYGTSTPSSVGWSGDNQTAGNQSVASNSVTATNQNTGSSAAHNNMQPSEVDLWIIKT